MDQDSVKPLKELLDSVRDIDGFPIGKDEDILALSEPPFYTACPNPHIKEFIEEYGTPYDPETDDYHSEPFVGDVSKGKNDPAYMVHSYPTKVPPEAIRSFIEHYTEKGYIVFDGFSGTGMTGVAAARSGRIPILIDLSVAASFISYNYTTYVNKKEFIQEAEKIIQEIKDECKWLYKTNHILSDNDSFLKNPDKRISGEIVYTVWSVILICPYCKNDFILWDVAVDKNTNEEFEQFACPSCNSELKHTDCEIKKKIFYDSMINQEVEQPHITPVLINYKIKNKRYEKKPTDSDIQLIEKIENSEIPYYVPITKIQKGDKTGEPLSLGYTYIHHLYSKRNLWILSSIFNKINMIEDRRLKNFLLSWFTSSQSRLTRMNRYMARHNRHVGPLNGTFYISPYQTEISPFYFMFEKKFSVHKNLEILNSKCIQSCQSTTNLMYIPTNSIDYIFTDPPFGNNLMYSELNILIESWLSLRENNEKEAIINNTQHKNLNDYTNLMTNCFEELFRILKPNRWITVEFHNSKASIWNGIQEAISRAGFIVAQVAVLDKKKGTINQLNAAGSVKNDLVINAYKPATEFSERFLKNAGEGMEVDFVSQQLDHLPIRSNIERTEKMLYSKMLAHYVENGFKIKYNSTNFYKLLSDNFTELDGYWFTDSQIKEYNKWKSGLSLDELRERLSGQQVIVITDEKSALTWMYYFLVKPHTYSDIYTGYQQVATTTDDAIPELMDLLENNFILEDGTYRRPLSESEKADVEKNHEMERERAFNKLLKQAKEGKGKIKNVRREALVYGFTKCYQEGRYQDILTVANKLYASTLEASGEIMDFVDIARIKTAGDKKKTIEEY